MRRRTLVCAAVAATLLAAGGVAGIGTALAESNGGVRVMPLGDSITEGTQVPGGYRIGLWQRLVGGSYRVDFTGSQFNGPASLGDHDHEGHPGWRIDQIDANIVGWVQSQAPRSVLLHIGTNDVLQNFNVTTAPNRLSTLIDRITTAAPNADVFVAQIIPLANAGQEAAVRTFNAAIPGIVQSKVNAGKRVHLVDMHSALTTADLIDGIHPTAGGYDKMAATWYSALRSVAGSIGDPGNPSPSASPTGIDVNAWYVLLNRNSGKALDVCAVSTADGACVQQWTRTNGTNQQFRFVDSGGGYYRLRARHSSKVLDVYNWSTADGAAIVQWSDHNGANQQFRLAQSSGGYLRLINRNSGKAVEVQGASTADGGRVVQYADWGGTNQQWQLVRVA
jgi:lysophospholipase L1-like esterase